MQQGRRGITLQLAHCGRALRGEPHGEGHCVPPVSVRGITFPSGKQLGSRDSYVEHGVSIS